MIKKILDFLGKIGNAILWPFRKFILNRVLKKLKNFETEIMEEFLFLLLKFIRLMCCLDKSYRRNIENFEAIYVFESEKSKDGQILVSAIFKNGKMSVKEKEIPNPTVKVIFKDCQTLWNFLTNSHPDIFAFVLDGKLRYEGNLNYILKFGYMAMHLKKMLLP